VAKKTQKKSGTKKATTKKVVKKSTKKTVAKKPVTKKAAASKATTKKVVKKTTKKTISKKSTAKKATTKKVSASKVTPKAPAKTKKTRTKKNGVATDAAAPVASTGPKKMVSRSNGSAVSERVAKLRMRLGRGGTNTTRVTLPEKPLTEAQLKKIKSGLGKKDLKYFKQLLLNKRLEILGDFAQLAQDVKSAGEGVSYEHMADTGTDNFEQEFNLGLMESERNMLERVNRALLRIEDKTYGVCVMTGKPINRERLEAKPWARYCIEVARELDRQGLLDK
tara:strand:+ start:1333 stop:2169 length:837 start_codon:yes stop_codon:yes gene_type:complete